MDEHELIALSKWYLLAARSSGPGTFICSASIPSLMYALLLIGPSPVKDITLNVLFCIYKLNGKLYSNSVQLHEYCGNFQFSRRI
jgi:hypothetical protein